MSKSKADILATHRAALDQRLAHATELVRNGRLAFMHAIPAGQTGPVRRWLATRSDDQIEDFVYMAYVGLMQAQIETFAMDAK